MKTIGILGANGQVGTEVCLYLSKMQNVKVIPICRTKYSSVFLRKCGLDCRHSNPEDTKELTQILKDCDLIADFTKPAGLPSELNEASRKIIFNAIKCSPPDSSFVYASSIMAYGMGKDTRLFKPYIFARTVYGRSKRYCEKLAFQLGKQFHKDIYILRLGQVHGELQSISRIILNEINNETAIIPSGSSYTVFTFSVAEALVNIAYGKEEPGLYTLASNPEWSWEEIHRFYCSQAGVNPELILANYKQNSRSIFQNIFNDIKNCFLKPLTSNAEVIASYLLSNFPTLEKYAMAIYYCYKAGIQISQLNRLNIFEPYSDFIVDKIPGKRLQSLSDSKTSMEDLRTEIKRLINQVT
ncbi:MAG: hypothetical protein A3I68_06240 [Candidatus Melainabacteria bacterium RIFCSPLOWO2_02_FULL_35_15]|nr:MAG: hypothetical protein A3F80_08170 [Candidatus Melainabacteria bacterium RIFCSPLOWO2_12_FULL_35_11]OGI14565.1 MAG: hypothetical protein A3I68_06240 [Candidatus Melainabacteria bacterium RIFCSPLOWO2_02_FULL_35_15]